MVGGERTAGLSIMRGDDLLGLADLPLHLHNILGRLAGRFCAGNLAIGKVGGLETSQGLTKPCDLRPMPRNHAVAVCSHVGLPESGASLADSRSPTIGLQPPTHSPKRTATGGTRLLAHRSSLRRGRAKYLRRPVAIGRLILPRHLRV